MIQIYLKLLVLALIPAAVSAALYLPVREKTINGVVPVRSQVIIGIIYGILTTAQSLLGIPIGNDWINIRDAMPVCAGLIFGVPAGIIAGFIGGVLRILPVLLGVGAAGAVASSVSVFAAGILASAARYFIFENRRAPVIFGFCIAALTVINHFFILLALEYRNPADVSNFLINGSVPMIVGAGLSAAFSLAVVKIISHEKMYVGLKKIKNADSFRWMMLLTMIAAVIFSTGFTYIINTYSEKTETVVGMISVTSTACEEITGNPDADLKKITELCRVGSTGFLLVADSKGKIVADSNGHEGETLKSQNIIINSQTKENQCYTAEIFGEKSYWIYAKADSFTVVTAITEKEVFATRNEDVYINAFIEILALSLLYAFMFVEMRRMIVKNIREVNRELKNVIGDGFNSSISSGEMDEFTSNDTAMAKFAEYISGKIGEEMQIAREIQMSSMPGSFRTLNTIAISASAEPARDVGGDFYDYFNIGENRIAFLIADVSGKGIGAAMFMMKARNTIRQFAEENLSADEILSRANRKLCKGNDSGLFVTVWMGIIDLQTGSVDYADAGHGQPALKLPGQDFEFADSEAELVLAAFEGKKYKLQHLQMVPGSRLYLFTDGVTEANNRSEEMYGEDRLLKCLNGVCSGQNGSEMIEYIKEDLEEFTEGAEQFDDVTMMIIDYLGDMGKEGDCSMTERTFDASLEMLDEAAEFVGGILEKEVCNEVAAMQIQLAFEELFVNVANYAYPDGEGDVKVEIETSPGVMQICMTDSGVAFNPLEPEDPDLTLTAEERPIGGLGIVLVKKSMDYVNYEHKDGMNIFTMRKIIG